MSDPVVNNILTTETVAALIPEAIKQKSSFMALVNKDFSNEFGGKGKTVNVRIPSVLSAGRWNGTWNPQALDENYVPITLGEPIVADVDITSLEQSLEMVDLVKQVVNPLANGIVNYIDTMIAEECYKAVWNYKKYTSTKTTGDITDAMTILNQNGEDTGNRQLVMDTTAYGKYIQLKEFSGAEKTGSTEALRNASMGSIFGFDTYWSGHLATHVSGSGVIAATDDFAVGTTELPLDGISTALVVGDILTVGGNNYVIKSAGSLAGNAQTVVISRGLKTAVSEDTVFALAGAGIQGLAFDSAAITLVARPTAQPMGNAVSTTVVDIGGLPVRISMGYNQTARKNTISCEVLAQPAVIMPHMCVRFIG